MKYWAAIGRIEATGPSIFSPKTGHSSGTWIALTIQIGYTHRVAISNNRLIDFADDQVSFRWKDYRHESRPKVMRLAAEEFIRRSLLHVLPSGFQRIRHYGFLANRYRAFKLALCRQLLAEPAPAIPIPDAPVDYRDRYQLLTGKSLRDCPHCGQGHMVCIETFQPGARGPPRDP